MNQTSNNLVLQRLLVIVAVLLAIVLGYRIFTTIHAIQTSGTLSVSTPAPGTTLSITRGKHTAAYIGTGSTRIRLQPGNYLVAAKVSGEQTVQSVTITKGHVSSLHINPASSKQNNTNTTETGFINFDTLVNSGLTAGQESSLEQEFTAFQPSAQVFNINPQTISVIVPDPSSDSTTFTMNFDVTIDSVLYHANAQYTGYDFVQLILTNTAGTQVYQGYPPASET